MTARLAMPTDSAALLAIYARYIATSITFEYELPSVAQFAARIEDVLRVYPYIALFEGSRAIAYAYTHRFKERAAYSWCAECSIYIDPDFTHQGIGSRLYQVLFEISRLQGVRELFAVVTTPNEPSARLHAKMGFVRAGLYRNAGYKNDLWWDISIFQKSLQADCADTDAPLPLKSISEIDAEIINKICKKYF